MLTLDGKHTALLSLDFQRDIALPGGLLAPSDKVALERFAHAMERAVRALSTARSLDLLIVHVRVAHRPGYAGANLRSPMGRFFEETGALLEGDEGTDFVPELGPSGDEIIVTKRGISAFAGTDLPQLLHQRSIDTVVLMGLVTHFAVEGTARDACDRGFRVVTLTDCCASGNEQRHSAALDILDRIGELTTSASLAASVA